MDSISSSLVDGFYRDDDELKKKRRITAIVGASYLLHLKATDPARLTEREERLLDKLLDELGVPEEEAVDMLREIEEVGVDDLHRLFGGGKSDPGA